MKTRQKSFQLKPLTDRIVCGDCDGADIRVTASIDPNTMQIDDSDILINHCADCKNGQQWCNDCNDFVWLRKVEGGKS